MTDFERLAEVIRLHKMSTKKFGEYIGVKSPQVLYDVLKGRNGISRDLADKIHAKCVDISYAWLLTGEGTMLKTDTPAQASSPPPGVAVESLMSTIQVLTESNRDLIANNDKLAAMNNRLAEMNNKLVEMNNKLMEQNIMNQEKMNELKNALDEDVARAISTSTSTTSTAAVH